MFSTQNPLKTCLEVGLLQFILFFLFWLGDSFLAFYVTLLFSSVCGAILLFALVAEAIEPSKIKRIFFYIMAVLTAVPWFAAATGYFILN